MGTTSLYASHLMGGEIELICVNPSTDPPTYRIRVRIYRDCAGIEQPSAIIVECYSSSCGVYGAIMLGRVSITDFTPLCPGQQSRCEGSGPIGWEEHVYESSPIQLPACPDWVIFTTDCCRNSSITTGSANEDFFIYIQVNTQAAPCNNSPRYSNRPAALLCNNQSFCFNPGVSDPDGDNLVFSLTHCRTVDVYSSIPYNSTCNGPCSGTNPLPTSSGTFINSTNGTVCLTPNAIAIGPVCLLIEEYRNGTKIGEYLRDMQIRVQNCFGNPPQASAINGTLFTQPYNPSDPGTYTYVACVNQNFCFTINFRDPDNENVTVLPPTGLPTGATWTVTGNGTTNATGQLCWTPTTAGIYNFTVTVEDNTCPVKRQNTYGYTIEVTTCPMSSADVSLSAQRQGRNVWLTWAVNVADSLQRFQIMRATRISRTFEPIATLEGYQYAYVDRDLAPNSYLYKVVQELPSRGRLESEAVEVVVHPVSETEFYVHGSSAPLGEAMLVSWIRSAAEPLTLTLYDRAGRQLYTHHTSSTEGSHLIPSPNAPGIYLLEVMGGDLHRTYRLLWY
jgi:hypothetical protein